MTQESSRKKKRALLVSRAFYPDVSVIASAVTVYTASSEGLRGTVGGLGCLVSLQTPNIKLLGFRV